MKLLALLAVALSAVVAPAAADSETSVSGAYALCSVLDGTGLTGKPCEVNGWGSAVVTTIDMSTGEARTLCGQVVGVARDKGLIFDSGWTLQIRSPYSGDNSIAFCKL